MTVVDLAFPLLRGTAPRDHGYALYGALCQAVPALHGAPWLAVHPLPGRTIDPKTLNIEHRSAMRLRIPSERIGDVLPLAGRTVSVAGHPLTLGAPTVHPLVAAPSLDARIVLVKLTAAPIGGRNATHRDPAPEELVSERYVAELRRQLGKLGIDRDPDLRGKRRVKVAGRVLLGYSVRVAGLDDEASLRLQEQGLGGKRRMGCGVFRPTRG